MRYLTFFFIIVIFQVSCTNNTNKTKINSLNVQFKDSFVKEWISIEDKFPFNSKLWIRNNYSFQYEYSSCLIRGYSKGEWIVDSPYIILSSYKIDSCMYLSEYGINCIPISENGEADEIIKAKTIKGCSPSTLTRYVNFERDSFYLIKETLFYVQDTNVFCPIKHVYTALGSMHKDNQ